MKLRMPLIAGIILTLSGCATTDTPPYYRSLMLDESTFKLGDTFVRPPLLWKAYTFPVERIPLAARLKVGIFHQGSTELPKVSVNGKPAGVLSPRWADLSSRDYEIFFFDREDKYSQALDYNTWTTADCWISPDLLKIGENKLLIITARAGTSQADDIKLKKIEIELRYLDREDTVTDLRGKSRKLPLPYLPENDRALYRPPISGGSYINVNAAGPDYLIQLPGMKPKTAIRLITERTENGPFSNLEDVAKRVKGIGTSLVRSWTKDAYCGEPDGEATTVATEIDIYRELKEIRLILEKQAGKGGKEKRESRAISSGERRGADREALAKIKLPPNPTPEQVRGYVKAVLETSRDQNTFSKRDPQVEMLTRVGPEHLAILLEFYRRNPQRSFHLKYAVNQLARAEHKEMILEALPDLPDLIEAVVDNGWVEDSRQTLIDKLRARPEHLPTKWIKAVASFKDPATYEDLKNYFISCSYPAMIYADLKALPGIDLADTVDQAWQRAKFGQEYQLTMMVPVAIECGHADALERAIEDLDKTTGNRVWEARELVLRFTDARGSNDEIREWYKKNKDLIVFDPGKSRFVVSGGRPSEEPAGKTEPAHSTESSSDTRFSVKTLKKGNPVPGFTLKSLDDRTVSLKDYRGKIVLLDFWATWCPPCVKEAPAIREAYQEYHDRGFEVIGISLDKDREKLEKFIEKNGVLWPQIFDGLGWKSALAQIYGVTSIPWQILLDRDLRVISPNARGENLDEALKDIF